MVGQPSQGPIPPGSARQKMHEVNIVSTVKIEDTEARR